MISHQKTESGSGANAPSPLNSWMALHQRACWLILTAAAVAGAALIVWLVPAAQNVYFTVGLAALLMLAYRKCAGAPVRALRQVTEQLRTPPDPARDNQALDSLNALDARLPTLRRKELAYSITCCRAVLLARLNRKDEALTLLRSFDRVWDVSQRQEINVLIQKISGEGAPSPEKEQA